MEPRGIQPRVKLTDAARSLELTKKSKLTELGSSESARDQAD